MKFKSVKEFLELSEEETERLDILDLSDLGLSDLDNDIFFIVCEKISKCVNLKELNLSNNAKEKVELESKEDEVRNQTLFMSFANLDVRKLNLSNNGLCMLSDKSIINLCLILSTFKHLKELDLSVNVLCGVPDLPIELGDTIASLPELQILLFDHNHFFDIKATPIENKNSVKFCNSILQSKSLCIVSLSQPSVNVLDKDYNKLCNMLKHNANALTKSDVKDSLLLKTQKYLANPQTRLSHSDKTKLGDLSKDESLAEIVTPVIEDRELLTKISKERELFLTMKIQKLNEMKNAKNQNTKEENKNSDLNDDKKSGKDTYKK